MNENNYTPDHQNENSEQFTEPQTTLIIDDNIKLFLRETIKWGKFLAIVGFVFTAIIAIAGLFIMIMGTSISSQLPFASKFMGGFIGFLYLFMGLIYYFPSKYLYDFSIYIKQALDLNDQESLNYSFSRLKSLYKFWGVLVAFMLVFYVLIIIITIAIGLSTNFINVP